MATKVKQIADEEAERVEKEEGDGETPQPSAPGDQPDTGETPPETPVPAPPTEASAEQEQRAFEKEMQRHQKALEKLWGLSEPLTPAPFDYVIGFVLPGSLEMLDHHNYQRCAVCNGHGRVLTGSLRQGEETADCPDPRCRGRGYWRRQAPVPSPSPVGPYEPQAPSGALAPVYEPVAPQPVAAGNGPVDEWERPAWMGDPDVRPGA